MHGFQNNFAVGAVGVVWTFFLSRLSFLFSFSLSLGGGPIKTENAVKPKTTNQPTSDFQVPWETLRDVVFLQKTSRIVHEDSLPEAAQS